MDEYFSSQFLYLLGIVIGKAIFERIPINSFLDRTILRQLIGGTIKIEDIYGFDKQVIKFLFSFIKTGSFYWNAQILITKDYRHILSLIEIMEVNSNNCNC